MMTSSHGKKAIEFVKAAMPGLDCSGMNTGTRERDDNFCADNVDTAIAFLQQCQRSQKRRCGSYSLKHSAERWGADHGLQPYISNGELIVAAVFLGFNVYWKEDLGPNVRIAVRVVRQRKLGFSHNPSFS